MCLQRWLCLVNTVVVEIRAAFDKRNMNKLFIPEGVIELLDGASVKFGERSPRGIISSYNSVQCKLT